MTVLEMCRFKGINLFKQHEMTPERKIESLNAYGMDEPGIAEHLIMMHLYNTKTKRLLPYLFLEFKNSEAEYDYDYEENLQYTGQRETISYMPLGFSPVNGKMIDFTILPPENDIDEDVLMDLYLRRNKLTDKRPTKKNIEELSKIDHEIHDILGDFPDVVIDDSLKTHKDGVWFTEDDVIPMEQFIQMKLDEMEEK